MADAPIRGQFVWHELMTTDTKSAAAFFTKVVGWKTQTWPQDPSYTMLVTDVPMAGLMPLPDGGKAMGGRPVWMSYISSPNVDDTARQAATLGGKILKKPEDIPTIGRFAVLGDPQGAVFIAFTPLHAPQGAVQAPAIGDFSWHELATTDVPAALAFYKSLFGWEESTAMDMGPELGIYQMFGLGGRMLGGLFNKPKEMPGPPNWLPYIHVTDAKKTAEAVKKLGGQVIHGPAEVPGGDWIVQGTDPQGGVFAVHSLKPAAAKSAAAKKASAQKPVRRAGRAAKAAGQAATKAATRAVTKAAKQAVATAVKTLSGAVKAVKKAAKKGRRSAAKKSTKKPAKAAAKSRGSAKAKKKATARRRR